MRALLDTVEANIGFDKLQQMRAASPTGGALGQVSERENKLLQATYGSLSQSQSEEQFKRNLRRLRETYLDTIHGEGQGPGRPPNVPVGEYEGTIIRSPFGDRWIGQEGKWVKVD